MLVLAENNVEMREYEREEKKSGERVDVSFARLSNCATITSYLPGDRLVSHKVEEKVLSVELVR